MTPSHVLMTRFALEAELTCVPSRTGEQCEALREQRQELGGGRMAKLIAYQDLILLTKDLTSDELRICRLRYGCTAGIEDYQRLVSKWNLQDAMQHQCETPIREVAENPDLCVVTGTRARLPDFQQIADALSVAQKGKGPAAYGAEGPGLSPTPGYGGQSQTQDQPIITARQVKRALESARSKVAMAIKWRSFQGAIEANYE